jgi:outer membrane protein OmpA-like peptidoglycan-associated protein
MICDPAWSGTQFYGASLAQARWSFRNVNQECSLVHNIPRYGKAVFWQSSGQDLQFAIHVNQPPVQDGHAVVRSVPPGWMHKAVVRELGEMRVAKGVTPIRWNRKLALRMYYELENGMFPHFRYRDWGDGADDVTVVISAVRFREVIAMFKSCVRGLKDTNVQADNLPKVLLESNRRRQPTQQSDPILVYFATDSDELTQSAQQTLSENYPAMAAQDKPGEILVFGHTDERASEAYNDELSKRRALAVKKYLVDLGVAPDKLQLRYFGEREPVDSRGNEKAWARNRRVSISLTQKHAGNTIQPFD